eukprot:2674619-Prymnesium_polylepis.1
MLLALLFGAVERVGASCVDHAKQCGAWAARGECAKNVDHMKRTCPKSCGFCDASLEDAAAAGHAAGSALPQLTAVPMQTSIGGLSHGAHQGSQTAQSEPLQQQPFTSLA